MCYNDFPSITTMRFKEVQRKTKKRKVVTVPPISIPSEDLRAFHRVSIQNKKIKHPSNESTFTAKHKGEERLGKQKSLDLFMALLSQQSATVRGLTLTSTQSHKCTPITPTAAQSTLYKMNHE